MPSPRVVLITGGNSGIGYEAVKLLLSSPKPYHVLLGSRTLDKSKSAIESLHKEVPESTNTVEALALDVTSDESIGQAFEQVKASPGHVDSLINNAGATFDIEYTAGNVSLRDCFSKAYDVNVTGAHVTTSKFMPLLLKSSDPRLLFVAGLSHMSVASKAYFPTPPLPAGWPKQVDFETIGYRCSKTALNMLMLDWNHKLKADGVKVWSVGPGFLATNLGNARKMAEEMGAGPARLGGEMYMSVLEGERDGDVGKVIDKNGEVPW